MQEFSPWSLRFHDSHVEHGFLARRRASLIWRSTAIFLIGAAVCLISLFFSLVVGKWHVRSTFASDEAWQHHMISLYSGTSLMVALLLVSLSLQCSCLVRRVSMVQIEVATILVFMAMMVSTVLCSPPTVNNIQRTALRATHGHDAYASDSGMLLTIDGIVTAVHLGLPVRWCVMLPLEVGGILLYALIVFVVGSHEPMIGASINLVYLSGLVIVSALGKRHAEFDERCSFRDIIAEKSLRCEAEFKLSNARDADDRPRGGALSSASRSGKSPTTLSGPVFNPMYRDDTEVGAQLAKVVKMGKDEHWCLNESEVKVFHDNVVGTGSYGKVVKGIFCKMMVAVKLPATNGGLAPKALPELCNELRIFRYLRHPNVVAFHGAIINPSLYRIALVLELVKGITLKDFLRAKDEDGNLKQVPDTIRYQIMMGVCRALTYMHTRRPHLVHGDIKSTNTMVEVFSDDFVSPKLLDFGLSRVLTHGARQLGGSPGWAAPELFEQDTPPKCSADVYSFGRLLAYIATSNPPVVKSRRNVTSKMLPPLPTWPPGCRFEPSCKPLVLACLNLEEKERPGISEVHRRLVGLVVEIGLEDPQGYNLEELQLLRDCEECPEGEHLEWEPQSTTSPATSRQPASTGEGTPRPGGHSTMQSL